MTWRPRRGTLVARLALWIALSTAFSFAVFAFVAYEVFKYEERDEPPPANESDSDAEVTEDVLVALAIAAPIGLGMAVAGAIWLTRRTLAPVDRVIAAAARVGSAGLDERLPVPATRDELHTLVTALNAALDRVETGYLALSTFAANVSHELRTPLAVMVNEVEVTLRRPRSTAEWEASARAVLAELSRMARLIDALLSLARADAIRPDELRAVDLGGVVEEALAAHAQLAGERQVTVVPSLHGAEVLAQRDALVSAVGNVVRNAVQHSPPGGTVQVALARATLVVEDSGPGLADGEEDAVFRPFYRGKPAEGTVPGNPGGLGLGLAIVRKIVERHGGQVSAKNKIEGGARFTIELPLAR